MVTVPVKGKTTDLDITDEVRAACESILSPISETMADLLARVEPEYQEKVRSNVIMAGGSSAISGLPEALEHALAELGGGRTSTVKEPVFAGSDGGLAIARDASGSDWERLAAA
jgi:rod shape-determining protein MreB